MKNNKEALYYALFTVVKWSGKKKDLYSPGYSSIYDGLCKLVYICQGECIVDRNLYLEQNSFQISSKDILRDLDQQQTNLSHLRPWGCATHVRLPTQFVEKLDARAVESIFIRYLRTLKAMFLPENVVEVK